MAKRISFAILVLTRQIALAQVAVQQPVIGTTAISTTVSVPDRGTTFLGGTSSALSGRSQYGPIRSGTSLGVTRQSSSMSVSVHVIDLKAMDEAILNSRPTIEDRARDIDTPGNSRRTVTRTSEPEATETVSPAAKAARSVSLALESEKAGKLGVAKLHWKMAAKYGSKVAEKRLAELNSK